MTENTKTTRIFWHLGFQKTGTSSIQHWLRRNEELFSETAELIVKPDKGQSLVEAGVRVGRPGGLVKQKWLRRLRYRYEVQKVYRLAARHPAKTLLVSNENISGYWVWKDELDIFRECEEIIELSARYARPAESTFVFYIRDFDAWLNSSWRQEVIMRRCKLDLDDWRAALPFPFDWSPHLQRLRTAATENGAKFVTFSMEEQAATGKIGAELMELCGAAPESIDRAKRLDPVNVAPPAPAFEQLLELNRSDLDQASLARQRAKILAAFGVPMKSLFRPGDAA